MQVHPNPKEDTEHVMLNAMLIAHAMDNLISKVTAQGTSFTQQHVLKKGLKAFGKQGQEASLKEMDQLHQCDCFTPILVADLAPLEHKKAMEASMFPTKK